MATVKMILCKGNGSPYLNCIGLKNETEFYISRSPFAFFPPELQTQFRGQNVVVGKVPYCKDCIKKIFEHYYQNGKNSLDSAVYYTCQKLDVPFLVDVYDGVIKQYENKKGADALKLTKNFMGSYLSILNTNATKYKDKLDFSYSDSTLSNLTAKLETKEMEKRDLDKFKLDWGFQEENDDYSFLEYRYGVYTDGKKLTPSQERLYRRLCSVELLERKKNEKKESTKEEQDMMLKLMDKLGISKFDEQRDKSDIDRILERQIWEIENTEPCELVDKEEYRDYLDIEKNWGKHIKRAIKNLVANTKDYPDVTKDEWD